MNEKTSIQERKAEATKPAQRFERIDQNQLTGLQSFSASFWDIRFVAARGCAYLGSLVTAAASGTLSVELAAAVVVFEIGWGLAIGRPSVAAADRMPKEPVPLERLRPLKALLDLRSRGRQDRTDASRRLMSLATGVGGTAAAIMPAFSMPDVFSTSGQDAGLLVSIIGSAVLAPALLNASAQYRRLVGVGHDRGTDDVNVYRLIDRIETLEKVVAADPPRTSDIRGVGRSMASLLRTELLPNTPLSNLAPYAPGLSKDAYVDILRSGLPRLREHLLNVEGGTSNDETFEEVLRVPMGALRALMLNDGDDDPSWRVVREGVVSDRRTTRNSASVYERAKRIQQICDMALNADPQLQDGDGASIGPLVKEHLPRLLQTHETAVSASTKDHDEGSDLMLIEGIEIIRTAVEDALSRSGAEKRDSLATELRFLRMRHPSSAGRSIA